MAQNTSPRAQNGLRNTCLSIPNGLGSFTEKRLFDLFSVPKRPIFIPSGPGTTLEKKNFFAPRAPVNPPLAPTMRGAGFPLYSVTDHRHGDGGVSLGDSEACKPQKARGCGWIRYPRNAVLSHVAQDTARSWFWIFRHQRRHRGHFWPFLAISRTYRKVRGQERALCHRAMKAHMECSHHFPSFIWFDWVAGQFWAKKGRLGAQNAQFWEGTSRLGAFAAGRHRWVFGSKLGFGKATT